MTGKQLTDCIDLIGVRDGWDSSHLGLDACEVCQALLSRSPLSTKAVWRDQP